MKIFVYLLFVSTVYCLDEELTRQLLNALTKAAQFYEDHFEQVNLDSIFGLRAAQGVLHELLQSESKLFETNIDIKRRLKQIYISIQMTSDKAYKRFETSNDEYDNSFKPIIANKWYYKHTKQKRAKHFIGKPLQHNNDESLQINEDVSDYCMTNLMGTQWQGERQKCTIPKDCWTIMTQSGSDITGYFPTHQGLYFILADTLGCTPIIETTFPYDKDTLFYQLGSKIYYEMIALKKHGLKETEERDLFLEQGLLCQWLGIESCFTEDNLKQVLSWQDVQIGCIKEAELMEVRTPPGVRILKVEEEINGGCLSHATGLFIAYSATFAHWWSTNQPDATTTVLYKNVFNDLLAQINSFQLLCCLFLFLIILRLCGRKLCKRWML